ncbi:MAG: hypothetical protein IKL22_10615 [Lachnospiraceae bacterium]|nr:hypothetical protein [Lachnospiraceae bacterium]
MKKKTKITLLILILILCIAGGIIAFLFFRKKQPNIITVEGQKYDLSEDFQKVVGKMVEDDIKVSRASGSYQLYDEDGKYINGSRGFTDGADIFAEERDRTGRFYPDTAEEIKDDHGNLISKVFYLYDMEDNEIISDFGIATADDIEDKLDTKTFIETDSPIQTRGDYAYTAVFVNGKPLDFSAYEEQLEEFKEYEYSPEHNVGGIVLKFAPHYQAFSTRFYSDIYKTHQTYEQLEVSFERHSNSLDEELLILFALEDAYQQLEEEETESFMIISFGVEEDDEIVNMCYEEFYFDDDWDPKKFLARTE